MFTHENVILLIFATLCSNVQSNETVRTERWITSNSDYPSHYSNADSGGRTQTHNRDISLLLAKWTDLQSLSARLAVHAVFENIMPVIDQLFDQNNVSISCQSSVYKVLRDAAVLKKYAIQMLDSCGKFPPSGMLEGTLTDLGRYDECLDIDVMLEGDEDLVSTRMQGQYCSVIIRPPLPQQPRFHTFCNQIPALLTISSEESAFRWLGQNAQYFYYTPFRIGLCSPSQCSAPEIQNMVSKLASRFNMTAEILGMKCSTVNESRAVSSVQLLCLVAFALLFLLVLTGTCIDVYRIGDVGKSFCPPMQTELRLVSRQFNVMAGLKNEHKIYLLIAVRLTVTGPSGMYWIKTEADPGKDNESLDSRLVVDCSQWVRTMRCFSIQRNGAAILNLEDGSSESLAVIHGLRVVTMAWIILGHTYGLVNPQIHSRVFSAKELYTSFLFQGLLNATLSVDTFFFISGLLTIYTFWKRMSDCSERKFPWFSLTVMRYFRLTPPYAAVIALAFVFPLLSSGPLWRETIDAVAEPCYESWWTNLLYVNNFVKTEKLCLMHSWYLSNDMQMHVFAVLFILLLMRSKIVAFLFMAAVMIACTAVSAVQTFVNEYPPTIISTSPVTEDRWKFILDHYYKPWPHLPSYCIGLGLGFLLATKKRIRLSVAQTRVAWLFVSLLCFVVLYGVYPWNMGWQMGAEVTALYSSTFRTLWTACCAWTTFALLTSNSDSMLAHILSWKGLLPLSRLTYMAFLVHPFVIWYYSGSVRERFTPSHFNYFHLFLGHYLLTYILSFALGLFLESPFMALQKLLISGRLAASLPSSKMPPAGPAASLQTSTTASPDPPLPDRREPDATVTCNSNCEYRLDEVETKICENRESFVYNVKNHCGSQSSVVNVNTV